MLLQIPDTLARWPWPRRENPWHAEAAAESNEWLHSFAVFAPAVQAVFDRCKFTLLGALAYPDATKDELRSVCDLMNLFFVIDEQTDDLDGDHTAEVVAIVLDAMRNPDKERPAGEPIVGEIARQFWIRASPRATVPGKARFMDEWALYLYSVVEQSRDRDESRHRTVDEYIALRRYTVGIRPSCAFAMLNSDLPLEVTDRRDFDELCMGLTDMVLLDNDLTSFGKEYAAGDLGHNIIPLVMRERNLNLQSAISWLAAEHSRRIDEFFQLWPKVSSIRFGSDAVDGVVAAYLDHLVNWVRANECWSFESERYFGKEGRRVQQERIINLEVDARMIMV
ncbi:terpenoid synthase [Lenzites betulinus]|nr:terpenoid synthase [Lenzites betulinus]